MCQIECEAKQGVTAQQPPCILTDDGMQTTHQSCRNAREARVGNHMNRELAKAFRDRWQAVAAVEAEEQRSAHITMRWQQMIAILRLAIGLGLSLAREDDGEIEAVRRRWCSLKGATT